MRGHAPNKQEIVKIELTPHSRDGMFLPDVQEQSNQSLHNSMMEIPVAGTVLRISNGTDPALLRQTLLILKELFCQAIFRLRMRFISSAAT